MSTSTPTKRARRPRTSSKSNVIYLQQRFPGRFHEPPGSRVQRIVAILQSATQGGYYGPRQVAALESINALLQRLLSGERS